MGAGVSFPEVAVAMVIFALLAGVFWTAMRWQRASAISMEKTDLTARLRNSSLVIGRALSVATAFLYPSRVGGGMVNQVIFRNQSNEVTAIFVNEKNTLSMLNYSTGQVTEITPFTIGFQARLNRPNLLEYQIEIQKDQYRFVIKNQLSTCNTLP